MDALLGTLRPCVDVHRNSMEIECGNLWEANREKCSTVVASIHIKRSSAASVFFLLLNQPACAVCIENINRRSITKATRMGRRRTTILHTTRNESQRVVVSAPGEFTTFSHELRQRTRSSSTQNP